MTMNKKTIRRLSNKYIAKWIEKGENGEYVDKLKAERERRAKKMLDKEDLLRELDYEYRHADTKEKLDILKNVLFEVVYNLKEDENEK